MYAVSKGNNGLLLIKNFDSRKQAMEWLSNIDIVCQAAKQFVVGNIYKNNEFIKVVNSLYSTDLKISKEKWNEISEDFIEYGHLNEKLHKYYGNFMTVKGNNKDINETVLNALYKTNILKYVRKE